MLSSKSTLRSIALEQPATIRVFERFHLDYCCGGSRPLGEVCAEKGIEPEKLLAALEEVTTNAPATKDFTQATLAELIRHIVDTHHAYVRSELARLQPMAQRVATKHGPAHPEVTLIERDLLQLGDDLLFHLHKEERILFPYIEALERSRNENAAAPSSCFGTVQSPIQAMIQEHEGAAVLLEEMRTRSDGFVPPADACPTYVGLYHGLDAFERDLHRHVHLENNLLFPRGIALEKEILVAQ
ncbi:MAG TPA: iron-sulfur cluster repair di-iron protein [Terracidiphilus sp.]|nr:iron-sulfur cluster repair di-iron protein [Terracidiphilus sp.]